MHDTAEGFYAENGKSALTEGTGRHVGLDGPENEMSTTIIGIQTYLANIIGSSAHEAQEGRVREGKVGVQLGRIEVESDLLFFELYGG